MIDRYRHPSLDVLFSHHQRLEYWRGAALELMALQAPEEAVTLATDAPHPTITNHQRQEAIVGHDVVAWLQLWAEGMPPTAAVWLHRGLTSSDIVDNAHFEMLSNVTRVIAAETNMLSQRVYNLIGEHSETFMLGRTHGQAAEPLTFGHKAKVWFSMLAAVSMTLSDVRVRLAVRKTPGAVGTRALFDSEPLLMVESTQVIHRERQIQWAAACLQIVSVCETITLEIRLMARSGVAEVREGARRKGSSAMPHKKNPIQSERVSGLARMARAHFAAIAESAGNLHDERDISNSSVERVAVPDLAHLTATIVKETANILQNLVVDQEQMLKNLDDAGWEPYSSLMVYCLQEMNWTWVAAHDVIEKAFAQEDPFLYVITYLPDTQAKEWARLMEDRANPIWMCRHII